MKIAIFLLSAYGVSKALFQSLIGSNENCNPIRRPVARHTAHEFQSLIGSNENCNIKKFFTHDTPPLMFQSLIGSNENCNLVLNLKKLRAYQQVSIPNRE